MQRREFSFDLPEDLIAQHPAAERDASRLLVVDPVAGTILHHAVRDLPDLLPPGTLCVPNDVKVRHARLQLRRAGGGVGEALLLRVLPNGGFEALVRPGARLREHARATVVDPATSAPLAELFIDSILEEGLRAVRIQQEGRNLDWDEIDRIGRLPLPPYIKHLAGPEDEARYQTVFHGREGEAVAAPTAGLHFTPALLAALRARDIGWQPLRLHVGLGTFRPMSADDLDDHVMHEERYEIPESTAALLEPALRTGAAPLLAIGTTTLRSLEAAWDGMTLRRSGATRLFIQPGYKVRTARHLFTNFHLPESTLFVLVATLLGLDFAKACYAEAVKERYRFFSYGDAMLITRFLHSPESTIPQPIGS
jgi:S-adenosylmethionine:tRNA ribosyltransferase-isomerase